MIRAVLVAAAAGVLFGGVPRESAPGLSAFASDSGITEQAPTRIRILAYNIHHGAGNDEVLDLERIAAVIRSLDPDLVALQEIDNRTARTGGIDQTAKLAELIGMPGAFGSFMKYQGGHYGMAVFSRLPFGAAMNHELPDGIEPRSSMTIRVRPPENDGELVFAGIHLYRTAEERMAQARRLLEILEEETAPVILAGDFNSTPDSDVMGVIADSFTIPDKGEDRLTLFSDDAEMETDFIAFRPHDRFTVVESRVVDEPLASDHRPVLLVVEMR